MSAIEKPDRLNKSENPIKNTECPKYKECLDYVVRKTNWKDFTCRICLDLNSPDNRPALKKQVNQIGPCLECNREMQIAARGLCGTCYRDVLAKEKANFKSRGVVVQFRRNDAFIYKEIARRAKKNKTSIAKQIISSLHDLLDDLS